jgi:hypothetical protein
MIDQPSLAILIDCWDIKNISSKKLYSRVLSKIDTNTNINTTVLASYNCKEEKKRSDCSWYRNYYDFFQLQHHSRNIKDLEYVHRVFEMHDTKFPNEHTDPLVLNYLNNNTYQIAMRWRWELEFYLSKNTHIKNIYVMGVAWEQCVKVRPLGYESLSEIKDINILVDTDCVLTMQHTKPELDSSWNKITESVYHYVR